ATERLQRDGEVKSGDLALQIGFGAGLVYAAQVVTLP
ncbi:MAG TPA: 3-oxoacyl-[acyl-carrier-protein] synthase III C-terminal domain-containing protein, partial [Beutenbergiaceae bacterium]|nr:3-oxoacyl-[acyl-carrier-protein] synthase III C-terminal domain-containing protein [Beutenbergiaceae bacterium]